MIRAAALMLFAAGAAAAEPADDAAGALAALDAAGVALSEAEGRLDRVAALTEVVAAHDAALASVRAGLRDMARREAEITQALGAAEGELSQVLGTLMAMQARPETLGLLHPGGPLQTVRAGMILSDVSPALSGEVEHLQDRLSELARLRALQEGAGATIAEGLISARTAREALVRAVRDRSEDRGISATETAALQAIVESADTLSGFVATLTPHPEEGEDLPEDPIRRGYPLPVAGRILAGFGDSRPGAAPRPGLTIAALPGAVVTAPFDASVRYAGPLLDMGEVAVLEPRPGVMVVLAGMGRALGRAGDIVRAGDAVGLMGGSVAEVDQILIESRDGTGQDRSETLYMEIRQNEAPQDPDDWFDLSAEQGR